MNSITISTNHWLIPSVENAFSGWLEGGPTEEEKAQIIQQALADRASWKPCDEAWQLVEQMKAFIGSKVRVELWSASMWWDDREAPFPFEANCTNVVIRQVEGFDQAYLVVANPVEKPTEDGFSSLSFLLSEGDAWLASFSDLYRVTKV